MTTPPEPPPGYGYGPGATPPPGWIPPQPHPPSPGPTSSDDTTWALLAHLSVFVVALIGPLVIYLVKRDSSPFVRAHAAEALNFHITLTLATIVSIVLMLVLIGFLLIFVVMIAGAVLGVIAAVAAGQGKPYRYPFTLRLVT